MEPSKARLERNPIIRKHFRQTERPLDELMELVRVGSNGMAVVQLGIPMFVKDEVDVLLVETD